MPDEFYNDGSIPYGSRVLTITNPSGSPVAYIAESVEPNRPSKILKRTNAKGKPTGSIGVEDFDEGSAVLQLATDSTAIPKRGGTFSEDFGYGSENWVLTKVGKPESSEGIKKVNVDFIKKYN